MTKEEFNQIVSSEPNYDVFVAFGFIAEIWRHDKFFNLNGYIYIPPNHPWFKKDYDSIDAEVHGGLTYSRFDDETGYWCIGFDTNHVDDISIIHFMSPISLSEGYYRDWNYVKNEVESLACQASLVGKVDSNLDDIIAKKFLSQKNRNGQYKLV